MPGFRYCSWCDGKGCMCCEAEQKKFAEKALANAPKWREGDVRDVRDACVEAEMMRRFKGLDSLPEDQVEAAFKPALDAEYARQFPNGPEPIFSARLDSATDMELLKHVAHVDVLNEAFGPDGKSIEEIESRAAEASIVQALVRAACNDSREG